MEFTMENIKREIEEVKKKPMTSTTLEWFVLLSRAKKYMCREQPEFNEYDAEKWIHHMNPPARWTKEQTDAVMMQHGYHHKPCEFWVTMNMLFSDYGRTVIKYGLDKAEFWAELAHDFLDDVDAENGKLALYWRDIVKH